MASTSRNQQGLGTIQHFHIVFCSWYHFAGGGDQPVDLFHFLNVSVFGNSCSNGTWHRKMTEQRKQWEADRFLHILYILFKEWQTMQTITCRTSLEILHPLQTSCCGQSYTTFERKGNFQNNTSPRNRCFGIKIYKIHGWTGYTYLWHGNPLTGHIQPQIWQQHTHYHLTWNTK